VQCRPPDVASRVDPADDEIRRWTEGPETRDEDDEGRKGIDPEGDDVVQALELEPLDDDAFAHRVDRTDACSGPARLPDRGGDDEVVAEVADRPSEIRETGGRDTVVVGHQDPHRFLLVLPPRRVVLLR
jgi:hypothetical protein